MLKKISIYCLLLLIIISQSFTEQSSKGRLLIYSDTNEVPNDIFTSEAKSFIQYTFIFDNDFSFTITPSIPFKVIKVLPGHYSIKMLKVFNRQTGNTDEYTTLNISFDINENTTTIFPLKVYVYKNADGAVVKGYGTKVVSTTENDIEICNSYIKKKNL